MGLVYDPDPAPADALAALRLVEVVERLDPGDCFAREWKSFDTVEAGTLIGTRHDGTPVVATHAGRIVFPNHDAPPLDEWFYLARTTTRFST